GLLVAESFEPETTRYGGADLLPASLDFFCLSTQAALETLQQTVSKPRAQQLTAALRRLVHQAIGAARDHSDFLSLLDYFEAWRPAMQVFVEKADQVFDRAPGAYRRSVMNSIREVREHGESDLLFSGASSLARSVDQLEDAERLPILRSQMHMTANRLGLLNPEESYLTRLACRAAETLTPEELGLGVPTPKSDRELIHA
ncbi:MAG: lantibiotic dehydratase C-terminal domain-containing protein, partial [Planctomycetota bacterium]